MKRVNRQFVAGLVALAALMLSASAAFAQSSDTFRVHPLNGQAVAGRLGDITRDKVTLQSPGGAKEFAVNEIKYVQLPSDPRDLLEARNAAFDENYGRVLELLDKIPPPQLATEAIRQDIDYYRALANAHSALEGNADPKEAGKALLTYLNTNKNSYHYYEANQLAGDLLVSLGRYDQAAPYYNEVAGAPWPDYKIRAAVLLGRALQAQGKHVDAIKQFDIALVTDAKGKAAEVQLTAAKIGKGKSQIELGETKPGLQLLNDAIDHVPGEDIQLQATAYNAQGSAYLKLNQPKDALYAFLHVDDLYNQMPAQHAEALFHLKDLWTQIGKPDRAKQAADTLKSKYGNSPWNK